MQLSNIPPSSSASHSSFQLSFLFCLLLSPTLPVGILLLSTISFPHRQHSLHPSFHFAFFFPSSLCCGGAIEREREGQKKKSSQLVSLSLSVCPLPFALLHFPAVGLLQTHAHASHPSPAMSIPRCCMVDLACLSSCRKGDTLKCAVLVH